jgi:hypothetical protein
MGVSKGKASRSPTKLPVWKRSPSPKKMLPTSISRSRLQGIADTLRAKANLFYQTQDESSEEALVADQPQEPPTPTSIKSILSKKSVRFRSSHSVIDHMHRNSSPISIPTKSPPSLAMVDISNTPMFDTSSDEEKNLGQTARPSDLAPVHTLPSPPPRKTSRPQLDLGELDARLTGVPALPTPMPGTNLPLEDPFDDAAAALHSDHQLSKGLFCSDQVYISDEESGGEASDIDIRVSHDAATNKSLKGDPSSIKVSMQFEDNSKATTTPLTSPSPGSSNGSPLTGQRTLRRMKNIPTTLNTSSLMLRMPSEAQYDADAERSDGSEAPKKTATSSVAQLQSHQISFEDETDQDSQIGDELVSCKTQDHDRKATKMAVPRLTLKKPSSDETEDGLSAVSSNSDAIMQAANCAEKGSLVVKETSPSRSLNQALALPNDACPTLGALDPTSAKRDLGSGLAREPNKVIL